MLRAQLKRDLKAGRVSIGALLRDPPPYMESAKVFDVLLAVPKVGRVKASKILDSCGVSPRRWSRWRPSWWRRTWTGSPTR